MEGKLEVEGDSSNVISWVQGSSIGPWRLAKFLDEISSMCNESFLSFVHIPRSVNDLADRLAKSGALSDTVYSGLPIDVASTWEVKRLAVPFLKCECLVFESELGEWELPGILSFLKSSPDLETLIINITRTITFDDYDKEFTRTYDFEQREYWKMQKSPFPCLVHHLKNVEIRGFMGAVRDMKIGNRGLTIAHKKKLKLVKFLLKKAFVLEKMTISLTENLCFKEAAKKSALVMKIAQEITGYPRASSHAEILFSYI
ncbi:uncharacterized protein LOC143882442 [Tasmannia lanceolata]|uniref:uncharacterized protein LOC143882442 n=1 Tax=Tasmannia lanceolata TaxID=3420 RepID=UPI004063267B